MNRKATPVIAERAECPSERVTIAIVDCYGSLHEIPVDLVLRQFDSDRCRDMLRNVLIDNEPIDELTAMIAAEAAVRELMRADFVAALLDRKILQFSR